MWIINVLPEIAIHAIFAAGVLGLIAGFFLGFIPFVKTYKLAIQVVSILVFTLGVYLEGGLADNREWQLRVKEMEAKVAAAEAKALEKNIEIQEKIVTKTQVVREKGKDIVKYVDRIVNKEILKEVQGPEREKLVEVIKYIDNCPVPQELIDVHNAAAQMNKTSTDKQENKK